MLNVCSIRGRMLKYERRAWHSASTSARPFSMKPKCRSPAPRNSCTTVSIRQHTSAYVSIRQHTSAYVNM